jgi:predicted nucleotidyltransferase component of viral defense system
MEPETTRRLAAATGFRADSLEKVIHLGGIAIQIEQHPLLGSALALKGGTALNLFSGKPLRLSVDLDFNSVVSRVFSITERPQLGRVSV